MATVRDLVIDRQSDRSASSVSSDAATILPTNAAAMGAVGTGAVIGAVFGAATTHDDRTAIASGIAGGVAGLLIHSYTQSHPHETAEFALNVRKNWDLTRDVFSRLVGYSPRTIASYEDKGELPGNTMRRYVEIERLRVALSRVMNPGYVGTWLNKPNPAFEGSTPMDVIARGEIDRVWASAFYLEHGMS